MLKRKIYNILSNWKNDPVKKPIIIKGCRQCGKTFAVLEFAKANYKHVLYVNFLEDKQAGLIFADSLNAQHIISGLTALYGSQVPLIPHKTCIIFDEIQQCPDARAALKFLSIDGRFDILCTGSLLGGSGYVSQVSSIPVGYEQIVDMFPLDFEEWLWANGINDDVTQYLRGQLENEQPVAQGIHLRLRQLLLEYVIVGGMPEAVQTFLLTHDVNELKRVQRAIIDEYKGDMIKYARSEDKSRIRECFESIPRQLARENKKFTYSLVRSGGRSKEYAGSLQWIEDAGIIHRCYNLQITELPLDGNAIQDHFKVYMADTGLFISMLDEHTQSDILQGNLLSYKGAIFENLMADFLGKKEYKLYFYHKPDSIELDFLMRYHDECTVIECKATTGNAKSLKTVMSHPEKYHVFHALKFGDYNIGRNGAILTLPFYMAYLL